MFDIAFVDGEPPYEDEEGTGLWGCTVLGDFSERFIAPTGWWSREDYERQWIEGAQRLLAGEPVSAFTVEAGRVWWTAWREGAEVIVHQRYLFADEMAPARTAAASELPYELVGPRRGASEEGFSVSEWRVSIDDLRDFVARRCGTHRNSPDPV
jgi:hypothetical protein